jgi:cytochrome b6-f complex iron-sulfur subunit
MNIKRRSFLTYLGVGWAASCFPLVLSACSSDSKTRDKKSAADAADPSLKANAASATDVAAAAGFKSVGTIAQLDKAGSVGVDKKVIVIRDPANKAKLIAVNPTCTHQGCIVKWEGQANKFECPCHNAHFAADGKVKSGPASKPLATYSAKIEGGKVLVKMT